MYLYYNGSSKDVEDFYIWDKIAIEKQSDIIKREEDRIEADIRNRGESDILSFLGEDSQGRYYPDNAVSRKKRKYSGETVSLSYATSRGKGYDDISGSDGIPSQTEKRSNKSVQESGERVDPESKPSIKPSDAVSHSMSMQQCRDMIARVFNSAGIQSFYDGRYRTADEWLRGAGVDEVAMYLENDYFIQQKYLNKIPDYLDGDITIEEVLDAYLADGLTGTVDRKEATLRFLINSEDSIDFKLYEQGTPVKGQNISNDYYVIMVKDDSGKEYALEGTNDSDRVSLDSAEESYTLHKLLMSNNKLRLSIERKTKGYQAQYSFTVDCKGYDRVFNRF